jgi:hypothetical protein
VLNKKSAPSFTDIILQALLVVLGMEQMISALGWPVASIFVSLKLGKIITRKNASFFHESG